MDLMGVIRARRSARSFRPNPIPGPVLHDILEAGRLAPSPGNCQSWLFGVVQDPDLRRQLAAAAGEQHWIASAPVVIALCARLGWNLQTAAEDDYGLEVTRARYGADFVSYLQRYHDQRAVSILFEEWTPSCAGEHMFLAAVSHGLSACWVGYLDVARASRILGLPDDVACLYLMPIGYAAEAPGEVERKRLEEIVFHDRWLQDKADLMARIEGEWSALLRTVAGLSHEQLTQPGTGGWSAKDNLAHVAMGERVLVRHFFQGRPLPDVLQLDPAQLERWDVDAINALLCERSRGRSVEDVLTDLHHTHAQLLAALEPLTFGDLTNPRAEGGAEAPPLLYPVVYNTYHHYREHRETLQADRGR